jgi:AraC family transcriptional regulator of arabinose operon
MTRTATPAPRSEPIAAGLQDVRRRLVGWRPEGTRDWLLVYTLRGEAALRWQTGVRSVMSGDAFLIAPGTPHDYGLDSDQGRWANIWVHFRPRSEWVDVLRWPDVGQGTALLRFGGSPRVLIERELRYLVRSIQGPERLARELAMNALERVLLLADQVNPLQQDAAIDPRIRRASHAICERLAEPLEIAALARESGLSRSRFFTLFQEAYRTSPQAYLEAKRLERVAQLLTHSTLPIKAVAEQTGFTCPLYLSRRFAIRYRQSPTEFRRAQRELPVS